MYYKKRDGHDTTWKFLHKVEKLSSADGSQAANIEYVLEGEDRRLIIVTQQDFLDNFESSTPFKSVIAADAVKETLTNIRAHSTIRFVALPFFLGAYAVLAKAFYDADPPMTMAIAIAGTGLSYTATVFEIVLSRNLIAWWTALGSEVEREVKGSWWVVGAHRNRKALKWARAVLFLPYATAFGFWIYNVLVSAPAWWAYISVVKPSPDPTWRERFLAFAAPWPETILAVLDAWKWLAALITFVLVWIVALRVWKRATVTKEWYKA